MYRRLFPVVLIAVLLIDAVSAVADDIAQVEAQLAKVLQAEELQRRAFRTSYPYARLQIRKATLARDNYGADVDTFVQRAHEAIDDLREGRGRQVPPGELTEMAYITRNDHTAQPYHLYLPPGYDRSEPTPLIVFLHGWVPTTNILDPWILPPEVVDIAGKHGCMLLIPYGRRNTDFQGVGEVDVFRAMEEVRSLYTVDDRRIYLNGVSMGGMGAWTIALRHPGVFAAVTPIAGQTEMYRWWGWDKSEMAPFKQWMVEWDNPYHLAPSMRGQKFFVQHGENDHLISSEQSRLMVEKAKEQRDGGCVTYREYKGEGHYIYFDTEPFERAFAWQMQHTLDPSPMAVAHKTYSLEYNRAFWATIEQVHHWGKPATVRCLATPWVQRLSGAHVEVDCENVARMSIDLNTAPLKPRNSYLVSTPQGLRRIEPQGDRLVISFSPPPEPQASFPPRKRHGLCGPCEEVFDDSFIVVQGTAGDADDDRLLAEKVRRFSREWDAFADGFPRVKLDTLITDDDIAGSNLVLFGRPQTNYLVAQVASRLPVRIGDHHYAIGGEEYVGEDLGLVVCYPNPLNPDRYVLIFSGEYWGEQLDVNHKYDMLPDFIIFTTRRFTAAGNTDAHLCARFFDEFWTISGDTRWRSEEPVVH